MIDWSPWLFVQSVIKFQHTTIHSCLHGSIEDRLLNMATKCPFWLYSREQISITNQYLPKLEKYDTLEFLTLYTGTPVVFYSLKSLHWQHKLQINSSPIPQMIKVDKGSSFISKQCSQIPNQKLQYRNIPMCQCCCFNYVKKLPKLCKFCGNFICIRKLRHYTFSMLKKTQNCSKSRQKPLVYPKIILSILIFDTQKIKLISYGCWRISSSDIFRRANWLHTLKADTLLCISCIYY